jgi:DNA-directed RNA polymerase specialized sigma24 family protein
MNQTTRDELDEQLLQLATIAQQHQPLTQERKVALTKLVNTIVNSGKLCHPQSRLFPGNLYEDIYNEALQELLLYICQNIHKYNPNRASVLTWVNFLLERRFFSEAIPKILNKQGITQMPDQDNIASPSEPKYLTEIVKECIELDPDNLFKRKYIENYPQANFQTLALQRISGKSWKAIATELEIKISTVSSFYYRCVNEFASKLKEYCSNEIN